MVSKGSSKGTHISNKNWSSTHLLCRFLGFLFSRSLPSPVSIGFLAKRAISCVDPSLTHLFSKGLSFRHLFVDTLGSFKEKEPRILSFLSIPFFAFREPTFLSPVSMDLFVKPSICCVDGSFCDPSHLLRRSLFLVSKKETPRDAPPASMGQRPILFFKRFLFSPSIQRKVSFL